MIDDPSYFDQYRGSPLYGGGLHNLSAETGKTWTLAATLAVPDPGSPTGWRGHPVWRDDTPTRPESNAPFGMRR